MKAGRRVKQQVAFIEIAHPEVCRDTCGGKYCTTFCPAGVFVWDEAAGQTRVSFEKCLECGACAIGCPYDNILCQPPRPHAIVSANGR